MAANGNGRMIATVAGVLTATGLVIGMIAFGQDLGATKQEQKNQGACPPGQMK